MSIVFDHLTYIKNLFESGSCSSVILSAYFFLAEYIHALFLCGICNDSVNDVTLGYVLQMAVCFILNKLFTFIVSC